MSGRLTNAQALESWNLEQTLQIKIINWRSGDVNQELLDGVNKGLHALQIELGRLLQREGELGGQVAALEETVGSQRATISRRDETIRVLEKEVSDLRGGREGELRLGSENWRDCAMRLSAGVVALEKQNASLKSDNATLTACVERVTGAAPVPQVPFNFAATVAHNKRLTSANAVLTRERDEAIDRYRTAKFAAVQTDHVRRLQRRLAAYAPLMAALRRHVLDPGVPHDVIGAFDYAVSRTPVPMPSTVGILDRLFGAILGEPAPAPPTVVNVATVKDPERFLAECGSYATKPEPAVKFDPSKPQAWPEVIRFVRDNTKWATMIDDMQDRHDVGVKRYGTPLQPHNGRDQLVDLYQEQLDSIVYAANNALEKAGGPGVNYQMAILSSNRIGVMCELAYQTKQMIEKERSDKREANNIAFSGKKCSKCGGTLYYSDRIRGIGICSRKACS